MTSPARGGELNRKIASGVGWMVSLKLADRLIGIISTVILARLLMPEDFGLIAMAMSIVAIVELIRALGFETALIQNQSATDEDYDTAWTLNIGFSILVALILVGVSGWAAAYYNEPRIQPVLLVIAASQVAFGLQNIGIVSFRKDLAFHKEFWFYFSRRLFIFFVTISAALIARNYWALLIGIVSGNIFAVIASFIAHPYRPRLSLASVSWLFGFSKWLLANQVLNVLNTRSLHFILGRFESSSAVGFFTVSYEVAALPTTSLISPLNRALFPGYAKMTHDQGVLREGVLSVLAVIFWLGIPAGVGIALTAEYLVPVVLGPRWMDAVPLIEILAVAGALIAARANFGTALIAMGKPRLITFVSTIHAALLVPGLFLAVPLYGVVGAAFVYLAVEALLLAVRYGVLMSTIHIRLKSLLARLWRPVMACVAMAGTIELGVKGWLTNWNFSEPGALVVVITAGAAIYFITGLLLWVIAGKPRGAEQRIIAILRARSIRAGIG